MLGNVIFMYLTVLWNTSNILLRHKRRLCRKYTHTEGERVREKERRDNSWASDSQIEAVINFSSLLSLSTSIPCRRALLLSTNTVINGGQHIGHHSQSNIIFYIKLSTYTELTILGLSVRVCGREKREREGECFFIFFYIYISACIKKAGS